MSDWTAFATAFLNDTAGYINDRKDKAEDYADELREQADRNKGKLQKLRSAASAQQGFIAQARGLYANDAQIEAALDSGPTGLQSLVGELSKLKSDFRDGYDADLVSEYSRLPEGFKATGNIDPLARYGLDTQEVGDTTKPDGGWWQKALGKDAMARTRYDADQQMTGSGMSVYDMAELGSVSGYTSMNESSFLSYVTPKRFNPNNKAGEQAALAETAQNAMKTPPYAALLEKLQNADTQYTTPEEKLAAKDAIQQEMRDYINKYTGIYVDGQVNRYGTTYLEEMADTFDILGFSYGPPEQAQLPKQKVVEKTKTPKPLFSPVETTVLPATDAKVISSFNVGGRTFEVKPTVDGDVVVAEDGEVFSVEDSVKARIKHDPTYKSVGEEAMDVLGVGTPAETPAEAPVRKGRNRGRTRPSETPVESIQAGPDAERLLQKFGKDILAYFRASGITAEDDDEEFKAVLADWYGENSANEELIGNDTEAASGGVIYAMRMMLGGGE